MSMGREIAEEMMIDSMVHENHIIMLCRHGIWLTFEGLRLSISKMETSHLQNTINWLNRNIDYPCAGGYIDKMKKEIGSRSGGEGI